MNERFCDGTRLFKKRLIERDEERERERQKNLPSTFKPVIENHWKLTVASIANY
jgi:hypothetical protein